LLWLFFPIGFCEEAEALEKSGAPRLFPPTSLLHTVKALNPQTFVTAKRAVFFLRKVFPFLSIPDLMALRIREGISSNGPLARLNKLFLVARSDLSPIVPRQFWRRAETGCVLFSFRTADSGTNSQNYFLGLESGGRFPFVFSCPVARAPVCVSSTVPRDNHLPSARAENDPISNPKEVPPRIFCFCAPALPFVEHYYCRRIL